MISRILFSVSIALGAMALVAMPASAKVKIDTALMKVLDPDNDGTVDLAEAKAAGADTFKKLDADNSGKLDAKKLAGRVKAKELKKADPDNDGTLDQSEYEALVEKRFIEANRRHDGTLKKGELKSHAGQRLVKLIH